MPIGRLSTDGYSLILEVPQKCEQQLLEKSHVGPGLKQEVVSGSGVESALGAEVVGNALKHVQPLPHGPTLEFSVGGLTIFPFVTIPHLLVAVRAPTALQTHWQHHTRQAAGQEGKRKRVILPCRHSADTGADFKRYLGQRLSTNMDALLARVIAAAQQSSALLAALPESFHRANLLLLK